MKYTTKTGDNGKTDIIGGFQSFCNGKLAEITAVAMVFVDIADLFLVDAVKPNVMAVVEKNLCQGGAPASCAVNGNFHVF